MKKFWKVVLVILSILLITLEGGAIAILTHPDIRPVNDSDLQLPKVVISDNENAYYDLIKIENVKGHQENSGMIQDIIDGKEVVDEALAQKIINDNQNNLQYFYTAAQKPKFQDPKYADLNQPTHNDWEVSIMFYLTQVSFIKAELLLKQKKTEEAYNEAVILLKVGNKIINSQNGSTNIFLAMKFQDYGWKIIQKIISEDNGNTFINPRIDELSLLEDNREGIKNYLKMTYAFESKTSDDYIRDPHKIGIDNFEPILNYRFKPNKTKQMLADWIREAIRIIDNGGCLGLKDLKPYGFYQTTANINIFSNNLIQVIDNPYETKSRSRQLLNLLRFLIEENSYGKAQADTYTTFRILELKGWCNYEEKANQVLDLLK